jgi:hypothetical protein
LRGWHLRPTRFSARHVKRADRGLAELDGKLDRALRWVYSRGANSNVCGGGVVSRRLGRCLAVLTVATAALCVSVGLASASSGFQLSISPARIAPGGTVTISTTPRQACTLTLSIAKKPFSHAMRSGWIQIKMPPKDVPGRVPVKVTCAGHTVAGSFTVKK